MNLLEHYATLKTFSSVIYCLYRKLARLELNGQVDSVEYENVLKLIDKIKANEKEYYENLSTLGDEKFILSFNVIAQKDVLGETNITRPLHDSSYLFSNKVKDEDIIVMRISSKITDIFRHMYYKDAVTLNVYDTFAPIRDKYFLDVLDSQIGDSEYSNYKKMLINAKYDYAFINDKDILELREYDEEKAKEDNMEVLIGLGTILDYKEKFSKLNNKTLLHPINRRRLLLDIDFIRASALSVPSEKIEMIKYVIESQEDKINEGLQVFLNILDISLEDKNNFDEGDIPYKRKF